MECEKCKKEEDIENLECVYYSEHEGYLCKLCYRKWLDFVKRTMIPSSDYKLHEKKYLEWTN